MNNKLIGICNIYAPNQDTDQLQYYEQIQTKLQQLKCNEQILGGDFNLVLDPKLDKKGGNPPNKKSIKVLQNIITSMNLNDCYRHKYPHKKEYTWRQTTPKVHCRLDYFLVSNNINNSAKNIQIVYMPFTDHKSIKLKFELEQQKKRPNLWKFNNSFLQDTDFTENMNTLITDKWRENNDITDLRVRYELLKFEIQQLSMNYGRQKAKSRRRREKELIQNIEKIEKNT